MKLAEMLNTSTSYIGEIEIQSRVPSMNMVERIAKALDVEPYRFFIDDKNREAGNMSIVDNYLENLTTLERQDLAERIIAHVSNEVEQILINEHRE